MQSVYAIVTVNLYSYHGHHKMKKVILFLCQGLEEYEASVFTDTIGWTTTYGLEPIELVTVGLRQKVKCAWNFTIEPEYQLHEIDDDGFDAIAIPGDESGRFYEDAFDERLLRLIQNLTQKQDYCFCLRRCLSNCQEWRFTRKNGHNVSSEQ